MSSRPLVLGSATFLNDEAWALAQFIKRVGWGEIRANAVNDDEAYQIRAALQTLQAALNEAGFSPR